MSGQVGEMRQKCDKEHKVLRGCGTQQIHANIPFRVFACNKKKKKIMR
jgi:hypothetical protein